MAGLCLGLLWDMADPSAPGLGKWPARNLLRARLVWATKRGAPQRGIKHTALNTSSFMVTGPAEGAGGGTDVDVI